MSNTNGFAADATERAAAAANLYAGGEPWRINSIMMLFAIELTTMAGITNATALRRSMNTRTGTGISSRFASVGTSASASASPVAGRADGSFCKH